MKTRKILSSLPMYALYALLGISNIAQAAITGEVQNPEQLRQVAINFLTLQSAGQAGDVKITAGDIDKRLNLPACDNLSPNLLPGSKPWGKVTISIRCTAPSPWQVYVQADVQVTADYYVAANSLSQGKILTLADMSKVKGDISKLPPGVITNPEQAVGKTMQVSVASGSVLRSDAMKSPAVVQQGQSVRVISSGPGFQVATDAIALNNASDGQIAKAKTNSGQTVSGIAKSGGIIEIIY